MSENTCPTCDRRPSLLALEAGSAPVLLPPGACNLLLEDLPKLSNEAALVRNAPRAVEPRAAPRRGLKVVDDS